MQAPQVKWWWQLIEQIDEFHFLNALNIAVSALGFVGIGVAGYFYPNVTICLLLYAIWLTGSGP